MGNAKIARRVISWLLGIYITISFVLSFLVSNGLFYWEILEHRAPFLVLELCHSVSDGYDMEFGECVGHDINNHTIGYGTDVYMEEGDHVLSIFQWNPLTNYCDDIANRWDVAIWSEE